MDEKRVIAEGVVDTLGITGPIRNVVFEDTDSPWNEKALIKRKNNYLDVKVTVWNDKQFLYGRIYRLFLYIYDVLNPLFQYNPDIAPDEEREPRLKDRHNQIWSIYVDSRLERENIDNFFNRQVRKNIFIDSEKDFSWQAAALIFQNLWEKETYTYPEITDFTFNIDKLKPDTHTHSAIETDINRRLHGYSVKMHLEGIPSETFRESVNELLSFSAYHCKDSYIGATYFGITIMYSKHFFAELIPTHENSLYLTILNPKSGGYDTHIFYEDSDMKQAYDIIKDTYNMIAIQG